MPLVWNTMCVLSFLHVDRAGKIRVVTAASGDKNETDKNEWKWDDKQWITSHVKAFLATLRSWASHTPEPWITSPKDNDKTNRAGPSLPLSLHCRHCPAASPFSPTLPHDASSCHSYTTLAASLCQFCTNAAASPYQPDTAFCRFSVSRTLALSLHPVCSTLPPSLLTVIRSLPMSPPLSARHCQAYTAPAASPASSL